MNRKLTILLIVCILSGACSGRGNQQDPPAQGNSAGHSLTEATARIAAEENDIAVNALPGDAELRAKRKKTVAEECETAQEAILNMRVGWNLGNALDSIGPAGAAPLEHETVWGNPATTPELIQAVREAGFSAIRVPITWRTHMDEHGQVDAIWMDRVEEIVNMILAENLYCIINVHHDTGNGERWLRADPIIYDEMSARYAGLWKQIARRFAGYSERLLFEGFNEITDKYSSKSRPGDSGGNEEEAREAYRVVNDLNQLFVDTVRSTGGNNISRNLICSTYYASRQYDAISSFVLPEDAVRNHLIAQVHCYCPYGFTFEDEGSEGNIDIFGEKERAAVDHVLQKLRKRFTDQGIPLLIGEFGAMGKDNTEQRAAYAGYLVKEARGIGAAPFWWDNGVKSEFQLLDRNTNMPVFPEIIDAMTQIETPKSG